MAPKIGHSPQVFPAAPGLDHESTGSLSLLFLQQPWAIAQGRLGHRVEEVLVLGPQIFPPVIQHGLPEYTPN